MIWINQYVGDKFLKESVVGTDGTLVGRRKNKDEQVEICIMKTNIPFFSSTVLE